MIRRNFKKGITCTLNELLLFVGMFFCLASRMFICVDGISGYLDLFGAISSISLLLSIAVSFRKISIKTIVCIMLIVAFYATSIILIKNNYLSQALLFAMAAREIRFEKVIKVDLIAKLLFMGIVVAMYYLGYTNTATNILGGKGTELSYGFNNLNQLAAYILGIYLDILYLLWKTATHKKIILSLGFLLVVALVTGSRSVEFTILAALVLSIIPFSRLKKKRGVAIILSGLFWFFMVISLLLTVNIESPFVRDINKILSGRMSLQHAFLEEYGISAFGNHFIKYGTVRNTSSAYFVLDSAYMQLLIRFGLVASIVFGYLYGKRVKDGVLRSEYNKVAGLVSFMFFGLMETGLFYAHQNPFLMTLLNGRNIKEKDSEKGIYHEKK